METKENIKVGILTISDTRTPSKSNIESFDSSGHSLIELINNFNVIESAKVVEYECVTDDIEQIQAKMTEWCSKGKVDVILSTGGTGFSPRDVTPEATLGLVQKLTPGISQAIMNESLKITPMAMLSRAVSGIYEKTLIINLPGSKKAAKECLRVIAYVIPHAVSLIRDEKEITKQFHSQLNSKADNGPEVPECVSKVACRFRESPFPKISMESALEILKKQAHYHIDATCPMVWIFSTGDELQNNENAHNGYIRDTNSTMIKQILEQDNYMGKVVNCGIVRDNWDDLCKNFEEAFYNADIVVTSGGVSMGEKDLIKHVLKEYFQCHIHFGRVNMKPGMPTTFATLIFKGKIKFVFCLPGNPVSAGVCSHLFLLPFLRQISGRRSIIHNSRAELTHAIDQLDVRPEYKRALLKYDNGEFYVSCLTNEQQSSRLLSFVGSNCLLVLPSSNIQKNIKANEIMDVIQIKDLEFDAAKLNKKNIQTELYQKNDVTSAPYSLFSIQDVFDWMTEHLYIAKFESRPTIMSLGYVLQSKVYSSENLPPFPASIKDGYAIKYLNDGSWSQNSNIFNVVQVSLAGTALNCQENLIEGECARISTGAPIPPGANCVVQVEDTSVVSKSSDGTVEISISVLKEPTLLENIRSIGSDISAGQLLLDEKTELGPFEIALLRSVGCENVPVYEHPTVFILPFVNFLTHETSNMIENMLKRDGFKGVVHFHSPCKNLQDLPEKCENLFENDDILVILDWYGEFKSLQGKCSNIETHLHIKNDDLKISLGLGTMQIRKKRVVFFNPAECDQYSIYNCLDIFILPFLRIITGKKHLLKIDNFV